MGIAYNTSQVTDGLLIYLDPANPRSYSGSGSTWYDLSGNSNHGFLQNSPTYSSSGGTSSFSFNGSNQYVDITSSPNTFSYKRSTFTVMGWARFT